MPRFLLCLLTVAIVWCPLAGRGEEPFRFESTPGKLPKEVVPIRYDILLSPDIDQRTFAGGEVIDIEVRQPTSRIVLNAKDLVVSSPWLEFATTADQFERTVPTVETDAGRETCTLIFPNEIPVGNYQLNLHFTGKINQDGAGLFASTYTGADGKPETMVCTQMEPTDARRVFPCWDEPSFRAKFSVGVSLPPAYKDWTAVSNMPEASATPQVQGGVLHTFQTTPPMASYLVVVAVGNFEQISGEADGTAIHVITAKGRVQHGKYALESAQQLLHFYNEYFGIKFPLPKLDLIAVSGGSSFGGAMENWGGIVFAEPALLHDPATASQNHQQRVFEVIAHEMAHQWFGDLVTTAWWDNLWLNEGFAEWMGESATDHFNPGWQYWNNIAANKDYAMSSDARATTHPIQQPVVDEMDAERAFDEITYNKGQGFIRMLEKYLGAEKFRDGLRHYMQAHAYGNTTTADLWAALTEASGQPVSDIAAGWTEQPGFPLVSVSRDLAKPDEVKLSQRRFTVHDPKAAPLRWKIPLTYTYGTNSNHWNGLLFDADATIPATPSAVDKLGPHAFADGPLKLNVGGAGYYRVAYDEATLQPLLAGFNALSAPDQSNLLRDAWAAVRADLGSMSAYLKMVETLRPAETNPLIWVQVCEVAGTVDSLYAGGDPAARTAWRQAMISLLQPVFVHYGWQAAADESAPVRELRTALIERLGFLDDPLMVGACKERFAAFVKDPGALSPDLRRAVCRVVGHHADGALYDELLAQVGKAGSDEQKVLFYNALAGAADASLAQRTLDLAVEEKIPGNYARSLVMGVANEGERPDLAVKFVLAHLDKLLGKVSPMAKNLFVPGVYAAFHDAAQADTLEKYAGQSGAVADPSEVKKSAEFIRSDADLKARLLPEIDGWARVRR